MFAFDQKSSADVLQVIHVSQESVNDEYVTIVEIYFKNKDHVKKGDTVISIETSKVVNDLFAEVDGYIEYCCDRGDQIYIGEVLLKVHDNPDYKSDAHSSIVPKQIEQDAGTLFSKKAQKLINEHLLDKSLFKSKKLVREEDVQAILHKHDKRNDVEYKKITAVKKREIDTLLAVQSSALSNVVSTYIDVTNIQKKMEESLKFFKGSLLPVILPYLPELLRKNPNLNAFYNNGQVGYYNDVSIGFATNLGDGLRVLKLPDMAGKQLKEVEAEIFSIIKRFLDQKLTMDDMAKTTFTITDLSNIGVMFFVPLINKEQSAIIGISAIDEQLSRCHISISFDHRIADGKEAGAFLKELKRKIEREI
jgi:2-oxoglutarate dehydrogenase E2 component (dihydrolipoamide succinyltransferase)